MRFTSCKLTPTQIWEVASIIFQKLFQWPQLLSFRYYAIWSLPVMRLDRHTYTQYFYDNLELGHHCNRTTRHWWIFAQARLFDAPRPLCWPRIHLRNYPAPSNLRILVPVSFTRGGNNFCKEGTAFDRPDWSYCGDSSKICFGEVHAVVVVGVCSSDNNFGGFVRVFH